MKELFVPLALTPGVTGVFLHAPCGKDELCIEDTDTASALRLLNGLICSPSFDAGDIVTADRDRIMAHLYIYLYGNKVESVLSCPDCGKPFDINFTLTDLMKHYPLTSGKTMGKNTYTCGPAYKFRLPTGHDELQVAGSDLATAEKNLLALCTVEGEVPDDPGEVQENMWQLAPVLSVEMGAICPECGSSRQVLFDIQSFLLQRLLQERPQLIHDIHCIASRYHWPHQDILELPRKIRKQYAALIQSDSPS